MSLLQKQQGRVVSYLPSLTPNPRARDRMSQRHPGGALPVGKLNSGQTDQTDQTGQTGLRQHLPFVLKPLSSSTRLPQHLLSSSTLAARTQTSKTQNPKPPARDRMSQRHPGGAPPGGKFLGSTGQSGQIRQSGPLAFGDRSASPQEQPFREKSFHLPPSAHAAPVSVHRII